VVPPRFVGVELYFEDLDRARAFYRDVLGLEVTDETPGHYVRFLQANGFVCLERKGSESYPSRDKAVLFFEVDSLDQVLSKFADRVAGKSKPGDRSVWAVVHDPEGHNVLLMEKPRT
jgi:predicted enzyme related to lactoylglutathione lyase